MTVPILYYDFWLGLPNSNPSEWKYQAWKLAARSAEMACHAKMMFVAFGFQNPKFDLTSGLVHAYNSIRLIVEYELTHQEGKTKYRFKKVAEYAINKDFKIQQR